VIGSLAVAACAGSPASPVAPAGPPTPTAFQPAEPSPRPRATDLGPDLVATLDAELSDAGLAHTPDESASLADQLLLAVNRRRVQAGLLPLQSLPELTHISRLRVEDMVERGYFGHTDPGTGDDLAGPLLKSAGFTGRVAENIFSTDAPEDQLVDQVTQAWFESPANRANLLDPDFRYAGLAVITDGTWWKICQLFSQRIPR
jgi:uncharacterized protein YkwD